MKEREGRRKKKKRRREGDQNPAGVHQHTFQPRLFGDVELSLSFTQQPGIVNAVCAGGRGYVSRVPMTVGPKVKAKSTTVIRWRFR